MLTQEQRTTLSVLGYLHYRMGRHASARRIYASLLAAWPKEAAPDALYIQASLALASIAVEDGRGEVALRYLQSLPEPTAVREAPALLLRAQALWLLDRHDEARNAIQKYMFLLGSNVPSENTMSSYAGNRT